MKASNQVASLRLRLNQRTPTKRANYAWQFSRKQKFSSTLDDNNKSLYFVPISNASKMTQMTLFFNLSKRIN